LRLVSSFSARGAWYHGQRELRLPMDVSLDDYGHFHVDEQKVPAAALEIQVEEPERYLEITATRAVDPATLVPVEHAFTAFTLSGSKVLDTTDRAVGRLLQGVHFVVGSISFATGRALEVMTAVGEGYRHEFIAESDADRKCLKELGTSAARIPLTPASYVEIFADATVDQRLIEDLASRRIAGVYADALGDLSPPARFFSLWRTLEFAFQARMERDLIPLLLAYPRVMTTMEFDQLELRELRNIRGRLGHAASRDGLSEVLRADTAAIERVGRLWCLVDWIVLSKEGPGRDARCAPLAELRAFIDRAGRMRMVGDGSGAQEWMETWSGFSPRFRG
jgi:hypothetical protein